MLLDEPSRSSTTVQLRSDVIQDGTFDPGGQVSRSGQNGDLNYLFNLEADPRYRAWESREFSFTPDGELTEVRRESRTRDETQLQASMNLGYTFPQSVLQFNALYETLGEVPMNATAPSHSSQIILHALKPSQTSPHAMPGN